MGLDFVHHNGMTGRRQLVEIMGAGGALFDYDGDGDLDIWAIQGGALAGGSSSGDRLFRNELAADADGGQLLRFADVSSQIGVVADGYGMGAAVGDIDNDGWPDLYLTNYGSNQLLRNRGDGSFEDITTASGTGDERWSMSATFLDFDRDGWLDLYVVNYVQLTLAQHRPCFAPDGAEDYCGPTAYPPAPDRLYRNRGDGTFEDVSGPAGIVSQYGSGLGVLTLDANGDGWPDLYVANDQIENYLWLNNGLWSDVDSGRFDDGALWAGLALNAEGETEASMGIASGDFDGDGDRDLVLSHLDAQSHTYYRQERNQLWIDATAESGLAATTISVTGFGLVALDVDNDGWLDLFGANGAVHAIKSQSSAGEALPLRQRDQLLLNLGDGSFEDVSAGAGIYFATSTVGRGAAGGDLDNDGDTDLVVFNNGGPLALLLSTAADEGTWTGARLQVREGQPEPIAAQLTVQRPGAGDLRRWRRRDGSYCAAGDPRLLAGLRGISEVSLRLDLERRGSTRWESMPTGRYFTLQVTTEAGDR